MTPQSTLIVLFCISTAAAVAVRPLRIPYTVALVIVGLVLGSLNIVDPPQLTKPLLFSVFLPGLLFEAAFNIDSKVFRKMWIAVAALAIPGVIVAIGITALLVLGGLRGLGLAPDFMWGTALVFAAVIGATDPVAVTSLFRQLHAPKDLLVLVEGESLLNDGTSIVFLSLILAYVGGAQTSVGGLSLQFLKVAGGGAVVGLLVGGAVTQIMQRIDEPTIEITLTMIAAYGSFAVADGIEVSGVIASVAAGMVCGTYGRRYAMSEETHQAVEYFWEYAAFALNSIVFLLIGFEVSLSALAGSWREIAIAYFAVLASRAIVVFGGGRAWPHFRRGTRPPMPGPWGVMLVWGGLRGALSMVLALSLSPGLPHRSLVVTMTAGVVLLTLLVQGLTLAPIMRRLGLCSAS